MLCVDVLTSIQLKIPPTSVEADVGPGWTTAPAAPVAPRVFRAPQDNQPWSRIRAGYPSALPKAQPKRRAKGKEFLEIPEQGKGKPYGHTHQ